MAGASLEEITSLLDKSLLKRVVEGRYDMHELVRQYGVAHLQAEPREYDLTRDRHSDYYAALLEYWGEKAKSPRLLKVLAEMDVEMDNVRLARSWMVARQQTANIQRSLGSLWRFNEFRGRFREHAANLAQAVLSLQIRDETQTEVDAERTIVLGLLLAQQGYFCTRLGRYEEAREPLLRSLTLLRFSNAPIALMEPLYCLGYMKYRLGEYLEAKEYTEECLTFTRALGKQWEMAHCLILLSYIYAAQGAHEQAHKLPSEGLAICRDILGDPHAMADCLITLSAAASHLGRYSKAKRWAEEGLALSQKLNDHPGMAQTFRQLGLINLELRDISNAEALLRQSVSLFREIGDRTLMAMTLIDLGIDSDQAFRSTF